MIIPILVNPHPMLRERAKEVLVAEIATPEFQKLLDDMIETMYAARGIGIAGPQVGVPKQVIIVEMGAAGNEKKAAAFINPQIVSRSWRTVMSEEGCLSVPGVYGVVKRYKSVKVRVLDREGRQIIIRDQGLVGIIFQHEIDHLDGVLFIDKAERVQPITEREPRI